MPEVQWLSLIHISDRIAELKSHDDMEQLLFIAARYIGRPLTSTEIGNILYYYEMCIRDRCKTDKNILQNPCKKV